MDSNDLFESKHVFVQCTGTDLVRLTPSSRRRSEFSWDFYAVSFLL